MSVVLSCLALLLALPAAAEEPGSGFTWTLSRQTVVLDAKGFWTATIEVEGQAHDAQSARTAGRVDLGYSSTRQTIELVELVTVKADGRRIAVAADKIFDIAPTAARDVYTDRRTKSIVFPDVAAGDSIRYVYRLKRFASVWPGFFWTVPVSRISRMKHVEITFDRPASLDLREQHRGVEYRRETAGERVRETFSWSNDTVVPSEAGATSELDWAPGFTISAFRSYAEIGDHYGTLHAVSAAVTPVVAELAAQIVGDASDRRTEARRLSQWVSQNIRYVSVTFGEGALAPPKAEDTIATRYGDCKSQTALLSALLSARGIASEPALINSGARYSMPETPVPDFSHVILYLPELDLYVDPTWHASAFGALPIGHHDKPVLHAVPGRSRMARVPPLKVEDNVGEVVVRATVAADGRISGTTREWGKGGVASDLEAWMAGRLDANRAAAQLRHHAGPGSGRWTAPTRDPAASEVTLASEFALADPVDLAAGEPLTLPAGLRFQARPGSYLLGTHDKPRERLFVCYAGRQSEAIEVALPPGLRPVRLPPDRTVTTSVADYTSRYAFRDGMLSVRREFVARPPGQVCTPEQSRELVDMMSRIRRDYASVVLFDRAL